MADRYPLIVDSVTNTVKEIPSGDNLNLSSSNIVNVANIAATGIITAGQHIHVGSGSTSLPAITATDTDTGIFFPSNDTVVISCAASERIRFTSQQDAGGANAPFITIDNPDRSRYLGISTELPQEVPLIAINDGFKRAPVGAAYSTAGGGWWPSNIGIGTSGRWQASFGLNLNFSTLTIPYMKQNVWYKVHRADVASFCGIINITVSDANPELGGTTELVRFGMSGFYGPQTGFTTMAKRWQAGRGGDMSTGIIFDTIGGAAAKVKWTTISGVTTDAVAMTLGYFGDWPMLKSFGAGSTTT